MSKAPSPTASRSMRSRKPFYTPPPIAAFRPASTRSRSHIRRRDQEREEMEVVMASIGLALGLGTTSAGGQVGTDYPRQGQFIRLIVGYAAGGSTDIVGRILADELGKRWGARLIVENRSG